MERDTPVSPPPRDPRALSRRGFLVRLGLAAGAGMAAPLLVPTALRGASTARRPDTRLETSRPALGTWVRIVARGEHSGPAIEAAFAAIATVDAQMSIHRPDSQLSRVNAAAGRNAMPVDAAVLDVVERACAMARRTEGVYDPAVLPLMRLYGFYGAQALSYPGTAAIDRALGLVDWRRVQVDRAAGTLGLTRTGVALDLGSIGKGWAVDRAVSALHRAGVRSGLVDVGGNVYGLGTPEDGAEGWSVGVFHPVTGKLERVFVLRDRAVATSGNAEQTRTLAGVRVGHLFDARRGRPANGHLLASVVAIDGTTADTMSTVAFLLGPDALAPFPEAEVRHFVG
jgi:thiamine biosynthesis lipoprotein